MAAPENVDSARRTSNPETLATSLLQTSPSTTQETTTVSGSYKRTRTPGIPTPSVHLHLSFCPHIWCNLFLTYCLGFPWLATLSTWSRAVPWTRHPRTGKTTSSSLRSGRSRRVGCTVDMPRPSRPWPTSPSVTSWPLLSKAIRTGARTRDSIARTQSSNNKIDAQEIQIRSVWHLP